MKSKTNKQEQYLAKKRLEASIRLDASKLLSPQEKLEKLDRKLGKGVGAVRERARLSAVTDPFRKLQEKFKPAAQK